MATIKSFTDISQSQKLAEILPIESADMYYWLAWSGGVSKEERNTPKVGTPNKDAIKTYWCSCWSLAALLGVLPSATLDSSDDHHYRLHCNEKFTEWHDNPIDCCVAMINRLHEQMIYDFNNNK